MKIVNGILIICFSAVVLVMISGCAKLEKYGEPISNYQTTQIRDILTNPEGFEDKIVTLEGKIVNECPTGCWFNLKDETGVIYIDLKPFGYAIAQHVGARATVEGEIFTTRGKTVIKGRGVEIK